MWELDHKKAECRRIDAFELWCWRRLGSPFDCREIKSVNSKGNQPWIFIGRIDAKAEAPDTLATWSEEPTHWKRPWCWERLRAGGEGGNREWAAWIAPPPPKKQNSSSDSSRGMGIFVYRANNWQMWEKSSFLTKHLEALLPVSSSDFREVGELGGLHQNFLKYLFCSMGRMPVCSVVSDSLQPHEL